MAISFDKALGIHEQALKLRTQRAEVLANNLANADTPGFKARDIDFKAVLQKQLGQQQSQLEVATTDEGHMSLSASGANGEMMYRNPSQPSIDGNTVESQTEIVEYTKNALDFQASFMLLNNRMKGLVNAIRGE
ncbi:flagellar basal body rod protein FlgB [Hahella sp. CCB-MM4]|uniref:flagellar basal body rod protein FlgB n=1 Tax=Hahella sp. (strain CCB-MM4) TaxID=1926491 RepID=UPI000B9BD4E5|nr:flagellar basal body rod protein FlgB [Hahella sp. CCB-MM4]OZG73861.1 flagellar basal body rod protein FlgB [Hahella sp. CCB-MM4]